MHAHIDVAYTDARAADLSWRLGLDALPALAAHAVTLERAAGDPEIDVDLRVLGSSHQVLAAVGGVPCSEAVACGVDTSGTGLPSDRSVVVDGLAYRFRSSVRSLRRHALASEVRAVVQALAGHPAAIVGRFPGAPEAVTALVATRVRSAAGSGPGVAWTTWHAYPQTGELVVTGTEVRVA